MSAPVLVVVEHDRGDLMPATLEAMTIARDLALAYDVPVEALAVGDVAARTVDRLGEFGAGVVHLVTDELLTDYGPEIWADCVTQAVRSLAPSMVIATGTDRGHEIMAGVVGTDVPPTYAPAKPGDIRRSWLSSDAARRHLEGEAWTPLDEGLATTIDWVRKADR